MRRASRRVPAVGRTSPASPPTRGSRTGRTRELRASRRGLSPPGARAPPGRTGGSRLPTPRGRGPPRGALRGLSDDPLRKFSERRELDPVRGGVGDVLEPATGGALVERVELANRLPQLALGEQLAVVPLVPGLGSDGCLVAGVDRHD